MVSQNLIGLKVQTMINVLWTTMCKDQTHIVQLCEGKNHGFGRFYFKFTNTKFCLMSGAWREFQWKSWRSLSWILFTRQFDWLKYWSCSDPEQKHLFTSHSTRLLCISAHPNTGSCAFLMQITEQSRCDWTFAKSRFEYLSPNYVEDVLIDVPSRR